MVAAIDRCKQHFRIGCLTNNVRVGEGPGMARDPAKKEFEKMKTLVKVQNIKLEQ